MMLPLVLVAGCASVAAAEAPPVRHPHLLLNRQEIEQVKAKVRQHPWAARLLDRIKEMAKDGRNVREIALAYALTGEKAHADLSTTVHFPLRAGQEVLLRFASEPELSELLEKGGLK